MPHDAAGQIVAGEAAVLARRYADALYELAEDGKQLDAVAADMRTLRGLLHDSAEFRQIAHHPRLSGADLARTVDKLAAAAKLQDMTARFLGRVAQNRRMSYLGAMIGAFLARLAAARGESEAEVVTARPLTPAQQEQLASRLRELAGGKVNLSIREDRSVLGGLVVKLGSRMIDASLKGKLERLKRQMESQPVNVDSQQGAA